MFFVGGVEKSMFLFTKNTFIFVVAVIQRKIRKYTKSHLFAIKLSEKVNC